MKKKFCVEVVRTDEYLIEIDESVYNEDWLKEFREHFYDFDNIKEIAEHLAQYQSRIGKGDGFIEGFGYVTRGGELPFSTEDFDDYGNWRPFEKRRKSAPGLNIIIVSEDEDISIDTREAAAGG